jgi:iron complex outermembrane recepter protein
MRIAVVATAICLSITGLAAAADSEAAIKRPTSIPAQELGSALQLLTKERDLQVVYRSELVRNLRTRGASGDLTALEALGQILAGTGLTYRYLDEKTVTITPASLGSASGSSAEEGEAPGNESPRDSQQQHSKEGKKRASVDFRVAQVDQTPAGLPVDQEKGGAETGRVMLEEVVVTAQKRSERLQDVPVPVTAISGDALVVQNQVRIQDYYSSIPGLSLTSGGNGDVKLSIRGISTSAGFANPTVGIIVDDAPYGSTTALGGFKSGAPDIDPSDLERVEVLRGPQGTLYGASSIGGLLKFVTVDPSTAGWSGRLQGESNGVQNGGGAGYGFRGSVNAPVSDTFAIRASAFTRHDPGYIDVPALGIDGVNSTRVSGGRVAALWRPSGDWSLKLSAMLQDTTADGASMGSRQVGWGDLQQALTVRGGGSYTHKVQSYVATVTGNLGSVKFTAVSGYGINEYNLESDLTNSFGSTALTLYGVGGAIQLERDKTSKFTQEFRLSGSVGERLDWLAGIYYSHENSPNRETQLAAEPATGALAGLLYDDYFPTTFTESAAFGDLTVHFTDKFDVQYGARESTDKQLYSETYTGQVFEGTQPPVHTKDNAFTYLVTPRLKLSSDLMAYARFSSGYRAGGPNPTCTLFPTPCQYQPDKTQNYELGVKGSALDRTVSFDASLYYIDWKNIQISVFNDISAYFTNASRAKSQGLELSGEARPVRGLTLSAWVAWNDAVLKSDLPDNSAVAGRSGDRLPYSSRFSGNLSFDQDVPLGSHFTGFIGGSVSYVGDRKGEFQMAGVDRGDFDLPSYAVVNLRTGVRYNSWTLSVFANNIADERGALQALAGLSTTPSVLSVNYIQPRAIGAMVSRTF